MVVNRLYRREEHYVQTFLGATYTVQEIKSINDLKLTLEHIIEELPNDGSLEIADVDLRDGSLTYTLKKGIVQ